MVRVKHRYFVVNVTKATDNTPAKFNAEQLKGPIFNIVKFLHGTFGLASIQSALKVKYVSETTGLAMLRVTRGPHRLLASALPLIKEYRNKQICISTLYTGATIKQCLVFIKKYQMDEFLKIAGTLTDEGRTGIEEMYMNYRTR